jgi:glucose dehydrogenase
LLPARCLGKNSAWRELRANESGLTPCPGSFSGGGIQFQRRVRLDPRLGPPIALQASRNGNFFVLDRTNGHCLFTFPFVPGDWSAGTNRAGQPIPNPAKNPSPVGTLVEPDMEGGTSWMSPSYDPETHLAYVSSRRSYALYYIRKTEQPEGFAGDASSVWSHSTLKAIDYQTGRTEWEHDLGAGKDYAGVPGPKQLIPNDGTAELGVTPELIEKRLRTLQLAQPFSRR